MEKKVQGKLNDFLKSFKEDVENKVEELGISEDSKSELISYIHSYGPTLLENVFQKQKRAHTTFPSSLRCISNRSDGQQCSRRKKDGCEYCGTHSKGSPYGTFQEQLPTITKTEVWAQEIGGIYYYLDYVNNVYSTEDIVNNKMNPRIIAKYEKKGDNYSIPEFNI
jgi:hypothetical protein